ncbi:MAG: CoA-binding protein [Bryobacterales bacterium]|nr:CoA-binding protein [Bryobacterales bacterium]
MRAEIEAFVSLKRIAVIGVSRKSAHFSRMVLKELQDRGYDIVLVHPEATEIAGLKCFPSIRAVDPPVEGAMVLTPPEEAHRIGAECVQAGVTRLWLYRGVQAPHGSRAVLDECPLMWLKDPAWFHAVHKGIRTVFHTLPV